MIFPLKQTLPDLHSWANSKQSMMFMLCPSSRRLFACLLPSAAFLIGVSVVAGAELLATNTVRSSLWSLQPLLSSLPPSPRQAGWARGALDAFILDRLEKSGLAPSPEADRLTLIRRVSFDLIGLPPTTQEMDAYLSDDSSEAYEKLVDRLLASPHFGERWARHWLDVVRYTESQGFEYDKLRDNAWHYRDYVIRSFNANKPYDQFMKEQVAGDVMEPSRFDRIVASSLLVCGPWDEAGNAQANVAQRMATREEELEDLVSVVGQTFLGLTLNCARCHDHKFDPIPQTDYYRIRSVFDGVKHGERTAASQEEVVAHGARARGFEARRAELEQEIGAIEWEGVRAVKEKRGERGWTNGSPILPLKRWYFSDAGSLAAQGSLEGGATVSGGRLQLSKAGAYFRSLPLPRAIGEKTLEVWVSLSDLAQSGGAAISLESRGGQMFDAVVFGERQARKWTAGSEGFGRTRDLNAMSESTPPGGWVHMVATYAASGEVALFRNGEPYGKPYKPADAPVTFPQGDTRVLLGMRHTGGGKPFLTGSILEAAVYDRALATGEVARLHREAAWTVTADEFLTALSPERRRERQELLEQVEQVKRDQASHKPLPVSYIGRREQPTPTRRLKRGDVRTPEEVVTPGPLSALVALGASTEFGLAADSPEAQRRLKFADWLADVRNPLPSRVMVNRLWQQHFGQGLVITPSDLGKSGSAPTHPELLDWLAGQFVASGWDLKRMHRVMVTSATYRQSSELRRDALERDAENQWLWRQAPRRLEAEALRDAMLQVSGEINLQVGGPSFRPFEVMTFPANAYKPTDSAASEFNRRTVYRMNVNSGKEPMLDAFDCPDPAVKTPRRGVTTTPLQALALMNNPFVLRQADRLAARGLEEGRGDMGAAIQAVYRRSLGRLPSDREVSRALSAVRERGLPSVCWTLLNSTEFLYVR